MKYLVAVSGGVDSVVLLHKLVQAGEHEVIVAHFDHGIREDSAADARFVSELAKSYGLPFTTRREELGRQASEELARTRRHQFLRKETERHNATLVTAHHQDDVIETIAINLTRGTGWRGLAVLADEKIKRPLLELTKADIYNYALQYRLEWVEDSTNSETKYLRNRLRKALPSSLSMSKTQQLLKLWQTQIDVAQAVDTETQRFLLPSREYQRYFFTHIDQVTATEVLRAAVKEVNGQVPTRPQAERALLYIKTAKPGSIFELGGGITLRFTDRTFVVEAPSAVL